MAFELKEGQGSLFKNDRREKDSHPHAKGTALIGGVEYWVSAWTKDGAKGKFQSLAFQSKEAQREVQSTKQAQRLLDDPRTSYGDSAADLNDEIPF